ncbi:MAG: hypothetical protein H7070_08555 [Saprospiraceae bacterium]|nr:hypothetical protein [Pyrinomonadaceae bacterium]
MKKSVEILLTADDEYNFARQIRAVFPYVAFIDHMYWPTTTPPSRASITDCESKFVYIWNRQLFPKILGKPREHGGFYGPQSGIVIQLIRSQLKDNELLSGTMGVGFDKTNVAMKTFVEDVWKILKKLTPKKVVQVDPNTLEVQFPRKDIRLGNDAYRWCTEKKGRFLRYNNSPLIYMKPAEAA